MIAFLSNGDTHIEACRLVLLRAKTCEILCSRQAGQSEGPSSAFLVGLVSGVDILLKVSAQDFLGQVKLSDSIGEAVQENKGVLGGILKTVCELEYFVAQAPQNLFNVSTDLLSVYQEANQWVAGIISTLNGR